jgi:hypothetical protein
MEFIAKNKVAIIVVGLLVGLPIIWYLASPLFIDDVVNESFPGAAAVPMELPSEEEIDAMSPEEAEDKAYEIVAEATKMMDDMTDEEIEQVEEVVAEISEKMPDQEMEEEMPEAAAEWVVVATGNFFDADEFHQGSGTATVYQLGDELVLRFEEFSSTNGPDLHVYLVENTGESSADFGEYIDLGELKGNIGDQNYDIPAGTDMSKYGGIVIYCVPFHVVFSTVTFGY